MTNRIARYTDTVPSETLVLHEGTSDEPQRRRFFVRIAVKTGNVHLAALVYTVAYCTARPKNKHGIVFTADKIGHQIGLKLRQTQKLFHRAIEEKYITGHRVPYGWFATVKAEWHRELYLDSAWDHFDVPESARLNSISAAIVMDYIDPPVQEVLFGEDPEPKPFWQNKLDVEGVMRLLPWLTKMAAWKILEKLTHPSFGHLVKKQAEGVYYYKLLKSRHDT